MILAVVGLRREARIVAGEGVRTVIGGGDEAGLADQLEQLWRDDPATVRGVISIGIAGGLAAKLVPGDVVIGSSVIAGEEHYSTDPAWTDNLTQALPLAMVGAVWGSAIMLADATAKASLQASTGAVAVDMESQVVARFAAKYALPLAVLRAISDSADQALPPAAQAGMRPDGGMDIGAVLWALARDPRQLPALIRTGMEAEKGFRALLRCHHLLGPALGQFGHLPLDVV